MFLQKQANVGALRQGGVGHLASFDFGGQPAEPTKLIYRKADTDQWPQWVNSRESARAEGAMIENPPAVAIGALGKHIRERLFACPSVGEHHQGYGSVPTPWR